MRKVILNKIVIKEIDSLDKREKQWVKAVIDVLEDERNSIEILEQKFQPLGGELSGYRKAKNRSFGIRIVFRILKNQEIEVMIGRLSMSQEVHELIELLTVGKRDKVYQRALERSQHK